MAEAEENGSVVATARLALFGALSAAIAQALLFLDGVPSPTELSRYRWGALLLALGTLAFGVASRRLPGALGSGEPLDPPLSAPGTPTPFLLGLAPALAVAGANLFLLVADGEAPWTRWLWLTSVLLLLWPARGDRLAWPRPRGATAVALGTIVAVALALRVVDLGRLPLAFHGDMAEMGLGGRELLHGHVPAFVSVGWASIPWTGFLPAALGLALADSLVGLRLSAALLGTAAVAGTYLLGAELFGRRVGLVAAAATAIGYTEIHFSRLPAYGDPVPFLVFGLYFLIRGLRTGERPSFVFAGILSAAASLLYYSGRVAPVLVVIVLGQLLLVDRGLLRRRLPGLTVAAVSALVTLGPMLVFFAERPEELTARHDDVSVFDPRVAEHLKRAYGLTSLPQVVARQAARSALVFNHTPDTSQQFGSPWPMLSPFLAPLAALGLAACFGRLRSRGPALLVVWWAVVVLGAAVLTSDAPFWPRLVVVLPAAALLIAVGFERLLDTGVAAFRSRPISGRVRLVLAAALLAAAGVVNWSWYTGVARFQVDAAEWLGFAIAQAEDRRYCMVQGPMNFAEAEVQFLAPGRDLREVDVDSLASCLAEKRVFVVYPVEQPELLAELRRLAPGDREVAHPYPNGLPGPLFRHPVSP